MIKKEKSAIILAAAIVLGAMPTAMAQVETPSEGVSYEIIFDGTVYPSSLETIEYPYLAASLGLDGDCILNVLVDTTGDVAGMTVAACSSPIFEDAAKRFIDEQQFDGELSTNLTAHLLEVTWDIGVEDKPFVLVSR